MEKSWDVNEEETAGPCVQLAAEGKKREWPGQRPSQSPSLDLNTQWYPLVEMGTTDMTAEERGNGSGFEHL